MSKNILKAQEASKTDTSTLTGTFTSVFITAHPTLILKFVNASNTDVEISYDGSAINDVSITESISEVSTKLGPQTNLEAYVRAGTNVYVRGTAGTGFFYVIAYYSPL